MNPGWKPSGENKQYLAGLKKVAERDMPYQSVSELLNFMPSTSHRWVGLGYWVEGSDSGLREPKAHRL